MEFVAGALTGAAAAIATAGIVWALIRRRRGPGAVARQERRAAEREIRQQERGEA